MADLSEYKNLCDWAVRSNALEDTPTLASQKDAALDELNKVLSTNYKRTHIDNWLSERSNIPKRVRELWFDVLLECEVEFHDEELGKNLRRLFNKCV